MPEREAIGCPVCAARMTLVRHGKTVVDVCEAHGVWLDPGELEAITRRVERLQDVRRRAAIRSAAKEAARSGKVSGWLLGPLALLFD